MSFNLRCPILAVLAVLVAPHQGLPREVESLFASGEQVVVGRLAAPGNSEAEMVNGHIRLRGRGGRPTTFVFRPSDGHWDFSAWNHLSLGISNTGGHLVRIEGRLDNQGAVDWAHSFPGAAVVPAASEGILGFSFSRPAAAYDGPDLFRSQATRPNGHRLHWKPFDVSRVLALRFTVHSAGPFDLQIPALDLSWPFGSAANADLEELPFLDRFGQVRALDWPGKLRSSGELARALDAEEEAASAAVIPGMNRFGGWADGPQREATGYFRTEKIDGTWWFVDPDGALFWSHGINSIGFQAATPIPNRQELFAWLPEPEDPLYDVLVVRANGNRPPMANFLRANLVQAWGPDAVDRFRDFTHHRLRFWGINTLGGWSDNGLMRQGRTPYTITAGTWQANLNPGGGHTQPDPFDPRFESGLRDSLESFAWARNDPWCLGVFIHNELEWPNDLAPMIFGASADRPAKVAFVGQLRERHGNIETLNTAWKTNLKDWAELLALREVPVKTRTGQFAADLEAFYGTFADRYFAICKRLMREILPNHLYLGCRIHRASPVAIEAAARYVDVYSSNRYASLAAANVSADIPVLITEFHFGAPDRGLIGTGLLGVHDQKQRGLVYSAYVVGGLLDSRVVGTHWFAFPDQSAAGRPGEDYPIGFIDVTGRAYPEFTGAVRRLSKQLYQTRHAPLDSVEAALEQIVKQEP